MTEIVKKDEKRLIPTYQETSGAICVALEKNLALAALFINCARIQSIEKIFGKKIYQDILAKVHGIIIELKGNVVRQDDVIVTADSGGEEFLIFLSKKRESETFYPTDLETLSSRLADHLNEKIFPLVVPYLKGRPRISVGYAIVLHNPLMRDERLLSRLVDDAKKMCSYQEFKRLMRDKEKLQELILKESIRTLFHPIIDIAQGNSIIGYEALTRGPQGTEYESPYVLFDAAAETDLVFELDSLCRRKALQNARGIKSEHKLFLNCVPSAILDPGFRETSVEFCLKELGIKPQNLVIEVTEREAIENYDLFREAVRFYSEVGFSIAVDDTGSGYSSLETVVELKPHYIKLDISIVRGIDKNILKQELLKALNGLANKMGSIVIAEGIETEEELGALKQLGITLGQGFLFGKPSAVFPLNKLNQ